MKSHLFKSHEDYIKAQKFLVRRRLSWDRKKDWHTSSISPRVVECIAQSYGKRPLELAVCHGVRLGDELDLFEKSFGRGTWLGTEIVEELCDGKRIIEHDFTQLRREWIGNVDLVYSNAFDHSRYPKETLRVWLQSLSKEGYLYIEWTRWHGHLGHGRNKADCYAATLEEYQSLFESNCQVKDVIEVMDRERRSKKRYKHYIFVLEAF